LLRILKQILEVRDDAFYRHRFENQIGLPSYDRGISQVLIDRFAGRRIVHAGCGFGTLIAMLAANGFDVAGIERNEYRMNGAVFLRAAILEQWPDIAEHYYLFRGNYPEVIAETKWLDGQSVALFTNVACWTREFEDKVIDTFRHFSAVIFLARQF